MATDHNFRIKNGLTVGAVEVIDSSGKLTANAFGTNSNEKIEDVVADMITGSTHSNITVTYNDANGTLAFSAAAQYGDSDVESYLDGGTSTPVFSSFQSNNTSHVGSSSGAHVQLNPSGSIELCRTAGNADPFIDFKDSASDDYDARIRMDGNALYFQTGGAGNIVTPLTLLSDGRATFSNKITATSVNTGHGDNELYAMNQNVRTTDSPTFDELTVTDFVRATGNNLKFSAGGTHVLNIDVNGKIYPNTHNAYDIGFSSTTAFRNAHFAGVGNFGTINTGQGATEVHLMNQNVRTTDGVTFATVNTGQGANELYAMNQNVRTTDSPTFGGLTLNGGVDFNGNNINDINQINATGSTGWLDFNMDTDSVYPQSTSDNQTVLGSVTHMNFVGDSNGNGVGGIFYWGYGVNNAESGTFTQTMALDRSGNLTLSGTVDGRDIATDGTKLDTIATNADVTPSWVPSSDPSYATQSYVGTQISNLVDSAPSTLDTLNELAAALGDDANFSTTVTQSIATKLPLAGGTMTGNLTISPSGSKIIVDAYNTSQEGGGIFFRQGFDSSNKYNLSIMARSRSNDGSADGLSINAYEGITFSTGSNSYNERLYLHSTAAFTVPISTTGTVTASGGNSGNWNTAYGWGDHASAGYITDGNTNWNNTYGFITSSDSSITNKMPLAGGTFTGGTTYNVSGDAITISSGAPQIRFNDTTSGADDFWIHVNSNIFYVLGDRDDSGSWESPHPLELHSGTNIGYTFGQRIFNEAYHPNADKWTTARTLSLSGDASGSVSWDGSGNATLSVAVANDSHTHDGRYFTETESDSRYWRKNETGSGADFGPWYSTGAYIYDSTNGTRYYWNLLGTIASSGCRGSIEYEYKDDENYPNFVKGTIAFAGFNGGASFSVQHDQHTQDPHGVQVRLDTSRRIWIRANGVDWASYFRFRVHNQSGNFTTNTSWSTGSTRYDTVSNSVPPNSSNDILSGQNLRATSSSVTGTVPSYDNFNYFGRVYARDLMQVNGNLVWHAGNDGANSGLDADLLDGQEGSYYLNYNNLTNTPSASANYYLNGISKSGNTLTFSVNGTTNQTYTFGSNAFNSTTIPTNNNQLTNGAGYQTASTTSLSNYMRLNAVADVTNYSHVHSFYTNGNIATSSGSQSSLQCYNGTVNNDAFMTFHVGNDFACYFGLDGGTNKLSVGGWSMGANSYEIYHAGNKPSLATLGYTGATNANYITNNNQLTNGAGYLTASSTQSKYLRSDTSDQHTSGQITFNGGIHIGSTNTYIVQHVTNGLGFRVGTGNYYGLKIDPGAGHTETIKTGVGGAFNALQGVLQVKGDQTMNRGSFIRWANDGGGTGEYIHSKAASPYDVCIHSGSYDGIQVPNTGSVRINYNGAQKFVTTSAGVSITGSLTASGNVTAYSDRNKKKNIRDLESATTYLNSINPKRFAWKDTEKEDIGFIAQDVEEAGLHEFVSDSPVYNSETALEEGTVKTLDYGKMVSVLWGAVKEQQEQIEELKSIINTLVESK